MVAPVDEKDGVEIILRHLVRTNAILKFEFVGHLVGIWSKYPMKNILQEVKLDVERSKSIRTNGVETE